LNFRYPIFLNLTGKRCLVTGEGFEVAAKVKGLVDASAKVTYVNPRAEDEIRTMAQRDLIEWKARSFEPGDLGDCFLVITDRDDNAEIFRMAEERGILCNAVDDPENCRFSFGSVHRQGDLTIALSTNGVAPALAVRLKQWLQREIGPEYGELLRILKDLRPAITDGIADFESRRALWYRLVDSDALSLLRSGDHARARQLILELVNGAFSSTSHSHTSVDS
jgi:siroheme synthase-like protein